MRLTMVGLVAVFFFVATLDATAAPKQLKILKTYTATVDKAKQPKLKTRFIATSKDWQRIWKSLHGDAKAPEIDFAKNLLLVETQDAKDPNRRRTTVLRDDRGVVMVRSLSTLIGFQPSNMTKYTFYQVPRDGVTGVQRYDRQLRKNVVVPLPK